MKLIFIFLFSLSCFASQVSNDIFSDFAPAIKKSHELNLSYNKLIDKTSDEEKINSSLTKRIKKQLSLENNNIKKTSLVLERVNAQLKNKKALDSSDEINLGKMKIALENTITETAKKISVLKTIRLAQTK